MKGPKMDELKPGEAKQVLEKERQGREEKCRLEISKVLSAHNCTLVAAVVLRQNSVMPQITVVANP